MGLLDWLLGSSGPGESCGTVDHPEVRLSDRIPDPVKIKDKPQLTRGDYQTQLEVKRLSGDKR